MREARGCCHGTRCSTNMNYERGKIAIAAQAATYARRVKAGEINASAVDGLLEADADSFGDSGVARSGLFAHGLSEYDRLVTGE